MNDQHSNVAENTTNPVQTGDAGENDGPVESNAPGFWSRTLMMAGLIVLGITPWAHAQLAPPNEPAFCPPLTSLATPTLFNVFTGTTPFRFPFQ
jgi:hypothetical protein